MKKKKGGTNISTDGNNDNNNNTNNSPVILAENNDTDDIDVMIRNKIRLSMKKIQVEDIDLGKKVQATDLLVSIPEEDPMGRGLRDLKDMEKKLSVKVVFATAVAATASESAAKNDNDSSTTTNNEHGQKQKQKYGHSSKQVRFSANNGQHGHVYIVGDSKKLEKKVFTIRNLISHYHWRLSGSTSSTTGTG